MEAPLPCVQFDIPAAQPVHGWRMWQETMAPFFEVETECADRFHASGALYNLGPVLCGPTTTVPQRYKRSHQKIAATGLDHYMVQLCRVGGSRGIAGGRDILVRPGDLGIVDLSQPCESSDDTERIFTLVLPQSLVDDAIGGSMDLHGITIRSDTVTGGLLSELLVSLEERLPRLKATDAPDVAETIISLLASALRSEERVMARSRPHVDRVTSIRVRRFIRRNLLSAELDPASIADHFHISRTKLYRFFEADGGVLAFIRSMRLRRAFACLADPDAARRSIREIADMHGFGCEPHFSRLFKRTFGVTPSQARSMGVACQNPGNVGWPAVQDWLRTLE